MRSSKLRPVAMTVLLTVALACAAFAQSTDDANPTPVSTGELTIKGPKKNNQQHYLSFTAGPGEVTLTLTVKVKSYSTFVGIKVFDAERNTLAYHNMSADSGSPGMAVKKFEVAEKQVLLMSFTSDANLAECRIKFGGAVELGSTSQEPPVDPSTVTSDGTTASDASTGASTTSESAAGSSVGQMGKNKAFTMSILDAVGQRFNIPSNGKLRIEMKDGTVQEIDLTQVKKILVKK